MNIFKRMFSRPRVEQKSQTIQWPLPQGSFLEYAFGHSSRLTAEKAMQFYRTNSTVATAVDKTASKIEQIIPVLKTNDGNIIKDHPVLDLLKAPNAFDTRQDFMGKLARHYLIKHDSHISMLGNVNRPPLEIYAVKPQNVFVTQSGLDYLPASYQISVGPGRGQYKRIPHGRKIRFLDGNLRELYHIMGFSSRSDDVQGDSPLEAAALETRQQIKGRTHNLKLLDNGGRLSLIVAFDEPDGIDADEHKERKHRILEDLSGSDNAGKIAVISGGKTNIMEAGKSNKDMDYATLDKVASEAIFMRYEIPLPLVSTSASTYNNMANALFDFYENTVLPTADILFSGLSKVLLPRYGIEDAYITYDMESINILIRQKLEEIKTRREINIETVNELRALLPGREPLSAEADSLYQSATLVPIGEDLFTDDNQTAEELGKRSDQ